MWNYQQLLILSYLLLNYFFYFIIQVVASIQLFFFIIFIFNYQAWFFNLNLKILQEQIINQLLIVPFI